MSNKFKEHKGLDLSQVNKDVLKFWKENKTFEQSIENRKNSQSYIFMEGPPSANGLPGIHHVISRTVKDMFCRYKTMQGYKVERKAGWDTHGLPVELAVEKKLEITKDDIGKKISVEEYNENCRKEVMKYTDIWEDLTDKMGYWVDMKNPYVTYDSKYIETLWWLLKELYNKDLLYKGYTIQPYSPAAGTGLSSHEVNMPGCYRNVKDTTAIAMFKAVRNEQSEQLFEGINTDLYFLAWTTTPWTLFSNTALAVGKKINYLKIETLNPYSGERITVIMAEDLSKKYFKPENAELSFDDFKTGSKKLPFKVLGSYTGEQLAGARYEQLLPYQQPEEGDAFRVIVGDFVSTEDGTGIVHIAPSFGADDMRVAKQNGIGALTLVNKQGKFVDGVGEFSGRYVKKSYDKNATQDQLETDVDIVVKLKKEGKLFNAEKYEHSYPHCWRTDKPILYYPLDSWFIKSTAYKDRMIELNKTINWQPPSTGEGRFGEWLANLVDWNLSRSRYWGTPLPIWRTEDGEEEICIGSFEELKAEALKAVEAGFMKENPLAGFEPNNFSKENYDKFDPHRPYVDNIVLVSQSGKKMFREPDLIDVWFDSGAVPYAQLHYPFEYASPSGGTQGGLFADFIAEGVDQTRGWFFTLHALAVMLFDDVAFKNIISNGLILDEKGEKMSKRKGNVINPFDAIENYGSDPLRWYMTTNASPCDSLKFNLAGVEEVKRKHFGTLYNTYSFFALYANIDNFNYSEAELDIKDRPEIDRWILSLLNTLVQTVTTHFDNYDPTKAGRAIQEFVADHLSNWYVRLNRKRFWGGEYNSDKISAYQTLYTCLETVAKLMAPISPFYSDMLFQDLNKASGRDDAKSVHLAEFPKFNPEISDTDLEYRMSLAQKVSSMSLSLRRTAKIKVRQPLSKIMIPILDEAFEEQVNSVKDIILSELNVKEIEFIKDTAGLVTKKIKPNFKLLGRKLGKNIKKLSGELAKLNQENIAEIENSGKYLFETDGQQFEILVSELEIMSEDMPGWLVTSEGKLTVALDVTITDKLRQEGIAREFINRVQNLRKEIDFDVTDKIKLQIQKHDKINTAVTNYEKYLASQTLAKTVELVDKIDTNKQGTKFVEIDEIKTYINVEKVG